MKHKKSALFKSLISLLLCFSMLIGTTFAWFTDSVMTGINTIAAGNLDVELFHSNAAVSNEQVDSNTKLFMDLQGDPILWEPGVVSYENLRVANAGDLALAYQLAINTANENFVVDASGAKYGLSQVLKVGVVEGGITATDRAGVVASVEDANWTTLANFLRSGSLFPEGKGESEKTWGVVIYWEPSEYDNLWNLNNGKQLSEGDVLTIDLGIRLIATQEQFENDSFGNDYDSTAKQDVFPEFAGGTASVPVTPNAENKTSTEVTVTAGQVSAVIPAGVLLAPGTTQLTLAVTLMDASGANISLNDNEAMRSLDVHIEGVDPANTTPITVTLKEAAPTGLNMGNYKLYHVENGATIEMTLVDSAADFASHNQFKYDPATGDIVLYMATFSEVAVVADTTKAWNGGIDHSWYVGKASPYSIANADQLWSFSQIVGGMAESIAQDSFNGKTVMLVSDININDAEESNKSFIFYPIGYNCSDGKYEKTGEKVTTGFYTFEGTFDGQGHSISNIYQNTWEMKGDNEYYAASEQYYRDGMGLFGKVYGGTVKNLTVKNFKSDGEYTTTGVIAAYADSKTDKSAVLENIAIVDCNPRVYNTGNGGIVGCGGWYSKDTTTAKPITFKNITVDKTNKISALWGSYDVACGGIMGQYYPNSGCGVKFENCNMAAQMDVYNDVCGNYQYYAYRYAGMMIGSIRNNLPADENGHVYPDMAGITASNCTVNFGDWNDYYYCEFVKNGHPSYSGPNDYKFSRVPNSEIDTTNGKENATCIGHNHTDVEDNQAVYLPFTQLFTGYGWGVTSKGLNDFDGITIQITESDQNESVKKFETKFTGNFLYRVGNQNTVNIGSLFDVVKNEDGTPRYTINSSGVVVTIDNYEKDANVGGTFKANTSDWTKGTIQFSGTGLVKITIQDYNYCTPTELIVEVVDAKNATSAISATSCNVVLLNDVTNGSFSVSAPYGFYGNGFTITLNPSSHSATKGNGYTGYITMNGGILDNVRIDGPVFAESNIYQSQALPSGTTNSESIADYFKNAVIVIGGNPAIRNSYISGARTAVCVKAGGNVVIENTRISGGAYANIEVLSANSLELMNVTTEQKELKDSYGTNKNVIGTGVVINNAETKLILDGLTQYNWMTKAQWESMLGDYTSAFPKLFDSSYANLQYSNSGTTYVNTGIIWACEVTNPSIDGEIAGYGVTSVKLGTVTGAVYTKTKKTGDSGSLTDKDITAPDYESDAQDAVPPTTTFDYTSKNNEPEQSGSNDYCYYNTDSKKFMISFDEGESKNWHSDILTVTKGTAELPYTVTVSSGATVNADGTITFSKAGDYTVTYTYTDTYNYTQSNGELVTYEKTYYQYVYVTVFVVEPESNPTTFAFGSNGYKTVTAGGLTYAMPNVTATKDPTKSSNVVTASGIGSKTIDGETIYYPIIGMHKVGSSYSYYNYFSIFEAVSITDANGTDVYNVSTTAVPSNLQVIGGFIDNGTESANGTAIFNYSTGKTIKTKSVTVKGTSVGLCYYPDSSFSSSTTARAEQTIVVKYCYTDTNGKAYYYYIGYWCAQGKNGVESSSGGGCFAEGTLITLADGTQKPIEQITNEDKLLAWDFHTGAYVDTTASLIESSEASEYRVINLKFADGTVVRVIDDHGFFDVEANNFVFIDEENVCSYIGHQFVKVGENGTYKNVELVGYEITVENVRYYTIQTVIYNNCIAESMFTLTPPPEMLESDDWFNYFEIGGGMKYDEEKMQADIEKYGLYSYEEFAEYATYEQFVAFNGPYLKVLVGRGVLTYEQILEILEQYKQWMT